MEQKHVKRIQSSNNLKARYLLVASAGNIVFMG